MSPEPRTVPRPAVTPEQAAFLAAVGNAAVNYLDTGGEPTLEAFAEHLTFGPSLVERQAAAGVDPHGRGIPTGEPSSRPPRREDHWT